MPTPPLNKLNIAQIFAFLFLASLFFPIRYVFPTKEAFQTGAYSDFTSISLYLSDIFLFCTWAFCFIPNGIAEFASRIKDKGLLIFITWLIVDLFWHYKSISILNIWFFAKYLELIVSYGTISYLFSKTDIKALFIRIFLLFTSLESILALWQFVAQKSIGFGRLGEQVLSPSLLGVAKIVSGGTTLIRGYGTFPHPNLLSAFILAGILINLYLLLNSSSFRSRLLLSFTLLINILGLTVTFSRAGYLALVLGLVIFFSYLVTKITKQQAGKIIFAILATFASLTIAFIIFKPYLQTRDTVTDNASTERIFYAKLGLQILKQNPWFGVGIGESVLHMQQFSKIELQPWQIQPVHNYFLLAAAEIGIPAVLILIWIFLSHLELIIKNLKSQIEFEPTTYHLLLTTILLCFLLLMQFDHYFYTLQQTQMLLWVILGIISAETQKPAPLNWVEPVLNKLDNKKSLSN